MLEDICEHVSQTTEISQILKGVINSMFKALSVKVLQATDFSQNLEST